MLYGKNLQYKHMQKLNAQLSALRHLILHAVHQSPCMTTEYEGAQSTVQEIAYTHLKYQFHFEKQKPFN